MGIIAGIYSKSNQSDIIEILRKMLQCQAHRDKSNIVTLEKTALAIGMANKHENIFCGKLEKKDFSTYDLRRGNGIHAIVDGIVLNAPTLQRDFQGVGISIPIPLCSFIVEVAYEKWGIDFMSHLEGEFSCAIWDDHQKRLILARDPYGHKPIHYSNDARQFAFSSEIKGVLAAGANKEIDLVGLSDYLSLNCIPYPGTIFKGIYQVPPGSLLIFEKDEVRIKPYWAPVIKENISLDFNDAVEMLSQKLKSAVRKRMVTDNTYCFLSGGIDSSAILSFASELTGSKVHAVTVGFEEAEESELADAERMAKHVGAVHHQVVASPGSFFDMLDTLVFHHDSPFTDTSAYPTYYAGKLAADYTDLILTGDGPDQSMGGSDHHVFALENNLFSNRNCFYQSLCDAASKIIAQLHSEPTPSIISKMRRKLYRDSLSPFHAAYDLRSYFPDIVKRYMCSDTLWEVHKKNDPFRHPAAWFEKVKSLDQINRYLYADMVFYVPDDLMIKVDRMCMAHGLETLSPFQDIDLAKVVNQLPGKYKIKREYNHISTKHILKKSCERRFPADTLAKKKQGFGIPLEKWLRKDNGQALKEILLDDRTLNRGIFKKCSIVSMVKTFLSNRGDYFYPSANMIAGFITLELWHRKYLDTPNVHDRV